MFDSIIDHSNVCLPMFLVSELAPDTPTLVLSPNTEYIQSTTSLTLRCASTGGGSHTYKFLRNGFVVDNGDDIYVIQSVSTTDSGTYTCIATNNGVDSLASHSHTVTVIG